MAPADHPATRPSEFRSRTLIGSYWRRHAHPALSICRSALELLRISSKTTSLRRPGVQDKVLDLCGTRRCHMPQAFPVYWIVLVDCRNSRFTEQNSPRTKRDRAESTGGFHHLCFQVGARAANSGDAEPACFGLGSAKR